jgi:hypothetical protein
MAALRLAMAPVPQTRCRRTLTVQSARMAMWGDRRNGGYVVPRQAPRTPPLVFRGEITGDRDFRTTACGNFVPWRPTDSSSRAFRTPRYNYKRQNGANVTRYFKYFSKMDLAGRERQSTSIFLQRGACEDLAGESITYGMMSTAGNVVMHWIPAQSPDGFAIGCTGVESSITSRNPGPRFFGGLVQGGRSDTESG